MCVTLTSLTQTSPNRHSRRQSTPHRSTGLLRTQPYSSAMALTTVWNMTIYKTGDMARFCYDTIVTFCLDLQSTIKDLVARKWELLAHLTANANSGQDSEEENRPQLSKRHTTQSLRISDEHQPRPWTFRKYKFIDRLASYESETCTVIQPVTSSSLDLEWRRLPQSGLSQKPWSQGWRRRQSRRRCQW